jgi:hypothetical protein
MCAAGANALASNMILKQIFIPAGETFSIDTERFILSDTDRIQAVANNDNLITSTVSYMQLF